MMQLPSMKPMSKVDYELQKNHTRERMVRADITKIDEVLFSCDEQALALLHKDLDGKYQTCISGWGQSLYGYFKDFGFNYEILGADAIKENLTMMRPKLEAFAQGWNETGSNTRTSYKTPDVNVTANNTVNISVSFQEARQKIEDMTALSREQTDEILEKIDELEKIQKENSSRKTKWGKIKPIIAFVMDKGSDVAVTILSLIVQMGLGI